MKLTARHVLLPALLGSALLHVLVFAAGEFGLPDFYLSEDEVLARKEAQAVPTVSLRMQAPPKPRPPAPRPGTSLVSIPAPPAQAAAQPRPTTKAEAKPQAPNEERAADGDQPTAKALTEANTPAPEAPVVEPPPPFPTELRAVYRANYFGVSVDIHQVWRMEGFRYVIENRGSKFGFTALMSSEGEITPQGIKPEFYKVLLNEQLKNAAQFNYASQTLMFGSARNPKSAALRDYAQDMASLPFHVALSFRGREARALQVTTGNSVYDIDLRLVAEETLKLPAGIVRTLHLSGSRTHSDGTLQQGYEVWLAPDYRNFPVKFRGPDGKGKLLEFSVKALEFEGQPILGKDIPAQLPSPDDGQPLPRELLEKHDIPPAGNTAPIAPAQ